MKKKLVSLLLCAVLLIPTVLCMPFESLAAAEENKPIAARQTLYSFLRTPDTASYSDDYFRGDSGEFNISLATCSFMASMSSATFWRKDVENSASLRAFLEDNGFTDFEANSEYEEPVTDKTSAVGCAHKQITDRGKTYTLIAIIPRSGTTGEEWARNLTQSSSANDTGDYAGFRDAADKALVFAKEYVRKYGIKGDIKVWTTGYSGGACTDNLIAAGILRDTSKTLGNAVSLDPSDMYCYDFSPMRVASVDGDYADSRYSCIHCVNSDADILANFPAESLFTRYGQSHLFADLGDKDKMLKYLEMDWPSNYEKFVNSGDPDLFTPKKIDLEALLSGELVLSTDDDPYLDPPTQAEFCSALTKHVATFTADAGRNSRSGYYKMYQQPLINFLSVLRFDVQSMLMELATGTNTSIPMILSMYMTFTLDRGMKAQGEDISGLIEDTFNQIAGMVENPDGSLKPEFKGLEMYSPAKNRIFKRASDGSGRYVLKIKINKTNRSIILKAMKEITAGLYALSMKECLENAGADEQTIDQLTSHDDSIGMSWFLTNVLFGDDDQSADISPLDPENEQIRHLATFVGCLSGIADTHMYWSNIEWLRSGDPLYQDYQKPTAAQGAGYRRVHISGQDGAAVSGRVTDGSGTVIAEFRDGVMQCTSDDWVGMTVSDSGYWLRLPLDKDYKVDFSVSDDSVLGLRLAEYSFAKSVEVRTVNSDNKYSWNDVKLKSGDVVTLDVPGIAASGDTYTLPSDTYYSIAISETPAPYTPGEQTDSEQYSPDVPKAKAIKAKASGKTLTVNWKKLSPSQKKKYSYTEVQYSTSKTFDRANTVTKKAGKKKHSLKLKKLKKGKYYVRVRHVKAAGNKKLVSGWSAVRKVKIK